MAKANPLLVFRIGWMEKYEGEKKIRYGGSYVRKNQTGGERWNFQKQNGRCYGYVMTTSLAGVDLRRLENNQSSKTSCVADIVFIARRPGFGQVVVGWYKNATVIHKAYEPYKKDEHRERHGYLCWADESNAVLLSTERRTFQVKRGKGFPGQSHVWYGDEKNASVSKFKKELRKYMHAPTTLRSRDRRQKIDVEEIRRIEKAAVSEVCKFYKQKGYEMTDEGRYSLGWDLVAVKNGEELLLEVKGHRGDQFHFELTPNEYEKMKANHSQYKVCGVLHALTDKPVLKVFAPEQHDGKWRLVKEYGRGKKIIELEERISARAMPM